MNSKGEPLRKVDLILLPLGKNEVGEPMPSYCVVSESDGKFEFYGIPPGRYRLMADRAGYLRTRYGAKTEWGAGTTLELRRGVPISGLDLRLPEQGIISGKLKFEGSPSTLYLALYQQKFQNGQRTMVSVNSTQVERSGEFLFNKLRPGTYFLMARPMVSQTAYEESGEEITIQTYYPSTADESAAAPLTVRGGQNVAVEFALQKARVYRVGGTVAGLPPNPGRVNVSLMLASAGGVSSGSSATPGADGTFQLRRVRPGEYLIGAAVAGGTAPRLIYQPLTVNADVNGLVLNPEPATPLRGSIRIEGEGAAAPKFRVNLLLVNPPYPINLGIQSGNDGSFALQSFLPGRYRYTRIDLPPGAYLKSAKYGDKDALAGVDLSQPSPDARLEFVASLAGARIDGAIVDANGNPAEGTATLIPDPPQPDSPWLYRSVEAGEGGLFQIDGIRPGKYRLYAWEELEPGAHMDPQVTGPHEGDSVVIEVSENERKKTSVKRIAADATMPLAAGQR
jgi:hypothetical protein